jgi:hypothetical protein
LALLAIIGGHQRSSAVLAELPQQHCSSETQPSLALIGGFFCIDMAELE